MPWFKVDDALAMHVKAFSAGNRALGLWVRCGSWSMQQLTDGHIPQGVVGALGGEWDDAAALVNAGLWHQVDDGYQFHDWAEYQPTRAQLETEREKTRERVEKHRANKRSNGGGNAVTNGGGTGAPVPVPSPDLTTYVPESSHVGNVRARGLDSGFTSDITERLATQAGVRDPGALARHINDRLGLTVHWDHLAAIVNHLASKAKGQVKAPQAYAASCITKNPEEVKKFIYDSGLAA